MAAAAVLPTQVPPPPQEVPVNVDNLQDLLRRKREIEKNKYKYHLTEADANLILTNANEYTFTDGQVILEEGHENASVYRIKSGKVELSKNGHVFCELAQGWFIGETLFLDNKRADVIEASLIAKGTVTLAEVNLPFVKKLFEVDRILALKFYRNLASKLSSIFYAISGNLMSPCLVKMFQQQIQESTSSSSLSLTNSITSSPSLSSISSSSTSSSSSSSNGGSATGSPALAHSGSGTSISVTPARNTVVSCPNVPQASVEVANRRRRLSKRRSISLAHSAYKVYTLENDGKGIQTCKLKNKKIKIINEAFGFKHKTTIHFAKIRNIVRTSEVSITVIFDPLKAKTLFFKTVQDLEEFYGLTQSLVETSTKLLQKSSPNTPLSHVASPLSFRLKDSTDSKLLPLNSRDNKEQQELDKEVMQSLATKLELRKGEILVEEGDLFQRIYTIIKGQCETVTNGHVVSTMKEGEVFGEASLLHLRPAPVTIRVSSETCSVLIIPAYKLHELINSNPVLAVRIFKKTAALVENKIDRVLATKHQIASEYCPQYANMVLERLNL